MRISVMFLLAALAFAAPTAEEPSSDETKEKDSGPLSAKTFAGLKLRSIGPAMASGRIVDLAVDPRNRRRYFAAAASGGVWLTENAGTTWTPVFDSQASYSIGVVTLDPNDPLTVWVGSGENNSQRSVSWGDGVYLSTDGGKTWKNMGLKQSEHIGEIVVDPSDSNVVYVAAQGPLWGPGGDRGLYKSVDRGQTWEKILDISENTGVSDVALDPRDSRVVYASAYQRRRRVWTMINGGPESALYKSVDGGENWTKLKNGLPNVDLGRIGIAVSRANPDVVYASVEAAEGKGGIFRSRDRGAQWAKRNGFDSAAFYYGEIVADPVDVDRIYIPNTHLMVSDDGGKTVRRMAGKYKHVDHHALWIDPDDTDYYLVGTDGGVYESFDRGQNWSFKDNLPITQFYNVTVDNAEPFYNVYGGTQDNFTLGGPSRTRSVSGIVNSDWFVVRGGDGFKVQVDPADPNIVYAEAQYGNLVRFDRSTGQRIGIKPTEEPGQAPLRWNWDSPLLISPHSRTRLYFAANKLFRSDDRGDSWRAVSGELSRAIDRNTLPVMGRIWPPEAVAKGSGTSFYGNCTALAESPLREGLLYVGTDDGLIQVSEDGGGQWRRQEEFEGVAEMAYVSRLVASSHSADRVYASFDNHKNNDFKPYLTRSDDRGRSWTAILGDLPENGPVLAFAEDPVNPNLLFAGTEYGLFFTVDGGERWIQLKGGLPTIAVRDLAIQSRESDLALATFGRSFYILDDYSPLRTVSQELLEREVVLFPVRDALLFVRNSPLGGEGNAFQGNSFYSAENPPYGALFTYYLKESLETRKQRRKAAEKKAEQIEYPTLDQFRREVEEIAPAVTLTVRADDGTVVRRVSGPTSSGVHRVSWNLRHPKAVIRDGAGEDDDDDDDDGGPLVLPGRYTVSLSKTVEGRTEPLGEAQTFQVVAERAVPLSVEDRRAREEFERRAALLSGAVTGALEAAREAGRELKSARSALLETPGADDELLASVDRLEKVLNSLLDQLRGDEALRDYGDVRPLSIRERVNRIVFDLSRSAAPPTQTHLRQFELTSGLFTDVLQSLRTLIETDLAALKEKLTQAGAPWTPGRLPVWPPR